MAVDEVATVVHGARLQHHRLMVTEKDAAGSYRAVGVLGAPATGQYTFHYLREAVERTGFRPFLGFSDTGRSYRSDGLFPLFAERIMDPRRPEHPMFLAALDLTDDVTPLEVLARSGGGSAPVTASCCSRSRRSSRTAARTPPSWCTACATWWVPTNE